MRLFDAHTHLSPAGSVYHGPDFYQLAVASTALECRRLLALAQNDPRLLLACGVHPWHSEDISLEQLQPYAEYCVAIGEIGMDSVWCQVALSRQKQVFRTQLAWAEELKKPVILHSKGCEALILPELATFSQPILVHWYSAPTLLEAYVEKGCYFTVGPDLEQNPAVRAVATQVPLDRLLLESDGIGGLSWAMGRTISEAELPSCLASMLQSVAHLRGMEAADLADQLFDNAASFLGQTL